MIKPGTLCRFVSNKRLNYPELSGHFCSVTGRPSISSNIYSHSTIVYPIEVPGRSDIASACENTLIPIVPPPSKDLLEKKEKELV